MRGIQSGKIWGAVTKNFFVKEVGEKVAVDIHAFFFIFYSPPHKNFDRLQLDNVLGWKMR